MTSTKPHVVTMLDEARESMLSSYFNFRKTRAGRSTIVPGQGALASPSDRPRLFPLSWAEFPQRVERLFAHIGGRRRT